MNARTLRGLHQRSWPLIASNVAAPRHTPRYAPSLASSSFGAGSKISVLHPDRRAFVPFGNQTSGRITSPLGTPCTSASPLDHDRGSWRPPRTGSSAEARLTEELEQENYKRVVRHTACFTPLENALLMTRIELVAAPSISAFLKSCALDHPMPRRARRPTINHEAAAQMLARLGEAATAFRSAAALADPKAVERAMTDLAEYRLLIFEALGRSP